MQPARVIAGFPLDLDRGVFDLEAVVQHACDCGSYGFKVCAFGQLDMRRKAVIVTGQ